ncbi:cobalt transporter subunit CbtB [Salinihabitans flavidus]|uniref:Cobalt transporter subunit CbtB n=2 Tax=Salinihabitans flavidus TaxID=569882 RepID=A0A1H8UXG5_9RHOB|nr:cobalt transporter subunit CbtB [Salinihabitans flavidus]
MMMTKTANPAAARSGLGACALALVLGVALLTVSGMAQATVLHDAAHDQRHAMAFPCH